MTERPEVTATDISIPNSEDRAPEDTDFFTEHTEHSPLWMLSKQPLLNGLVHYLSTARQRIMDNPAGPHELVFSRSTLAEVRAEFHGMIRQGEEKLHKLCEIFCGSYLNSYQVQSVVIGEVMTTHERFTLSQNISSQDLYSTIDLDLGNRQVQKLQFHDGKGWSGATLVANMVEYQPTEPNKFGIHRIISRIKAEEELWNKVVDEIFNLDTLVSRDKKLWYLSRYVKDVFGIKIVVGAAGEVLKLHQALLEARWTPEILKKFSVPDSEEAASLKHLEVKNYLGQSERKKSGWEAIKSVVTWSDRIFEIQIQPLRNFLREREFLTRESHDGFKSRREAVRNKVAEQMPLFGFYRDLLRWLFLNFEGQTPSFEGVRVVLED